MSLKISDLQALNSVTIGQTGFTPKLLVEGSNSSGLAEIYVSAGSGNTLRLNTNFVNGNYIDINPYITGISNGGFSISQSGTPRFVITAGGNIGIGTTNDNGYKLNVNSGTYGAYIKGGDTGVGSAVANFVDYNNTSAMYIRGDRKIGIGTLDPIAGLDNQSSPGTYRQNGFTTLVTDTLSASGTQARRFEIARMSIDYNDWNYNGPIEIELYERYYSQGLKKKYSIYYGLVSNSGCNLTEMTGIGANRFRVVLGPEVVISGDIRYVSIYVEVNYYSQVTAVLKTNRELQASNPPGAGGIWVNKNPSGTNIADFDADSAVYVGNIVGGNSLFTTGSVSIGGIAPRTKLDIESYTSFVSLSSGINSEATVADQQIGGIDFRKHYALAIGASMRLLQSGGVNNYSPGHLAFYTNDGSTAFNTVPPERLRIASSGNVLINTQTDAGYKLDVNGMGRFQTNLRSPLIGANASPENGYPLTVGCSSGANGIKIIGRSDNLGYIEFFNSNGSTVNSSINGSTSGLQITGTTTFSNTVTAAGFFNSSDIRLKEIVPYEYSVSDIKPISYLWKDLRDNKKHIGYSAQDVQKVMPDAVNEGEDGMLSVNYVEVLVAKIAELENRIKQLEK